MLELRVVCCIEESTGEYGSKGEEESKTWGEKEKRIDWMEEVSKEVDGNKGRKEG